MITNEQIKSLQQRVETLKSLDIDSRRAEVEEKQQKTLAPDFWNDPKEAEKFLKELAGVKFWVAGYDKAASQVADLDVLYDFAKDSLSGAADDAVMPYYWGTKGECKDRSGRLWFWQMCPYRICKRTF